MILGVVAQFSYSLSESLDSRHLGTLQQKQDGGYNFLQEVGAGGGFEERRTGGLEESSGPGLGPEGEGAKTASDLIFWQQSLCRYHLQPWSSNRLQPSRRPHEFRIWVVCSQRTWEL